MGNIWRKKIQPSTEYLKEPQMCSWKLRGSWVDIYHEIPPPEKQLLSEDESTIINTLAEPAMEKLTMQTVESCVQHHVSSADEGICNSPDTTSVVDSLVSLKAIELVLSNEMRLGEITENKCAAIMATLRRHSTQLCEGVSVMCLMAILYSNNVMDSLVFSGVASATDKSQYLVQELLKAVERDPGKFEAVCGSISMAHSLAYGHLMWGDYERELAALEETQDNQLVHDLCDQLAYAAARFFSSVSGD